MKIYIDESKRLGKGKIIIGGFFTFHNTQFIENFIKNKKKDFKIPDYVELKSIDTYGRIFIDGINGDNEFEKLDIVTFGFCFDNYYSDSTEKYFKFLLDILRFLLEGDIKNGEKVTIFHDNINAKHNEKFCKKIEKYLKDNMDIKGIFKFHNSKKYLSLQLADLIVSKYKEYYLFDDVQNLDKFIYQKDIDNKKT